MYSLDDITNVPRYIFVFSTSLTRPAVTIVSQWSPNFINTDYPSGCVGIATNCRFPGTVDTANLGMTAQIQTLVNDRFLMVRGQRIRRQDVTLALSPHDSPDPSYYVITQAETVGVIVYETGIKINCLEGVAFETFRASTTSVKITFSLQYLYTEYLPGVYGMLATYNSLTDMTGVRVFNKTYSGFSVITQEDQCLTEQMEHTTKESITAIVIGRVSNYGVDKCYIKPPVEDFPTAIPTQVPTHVPTRNPTNIPTQFPSRVPTSNPTGFCELNSFALKMVHIAK